jgi:hypothetical protein
MINLNTLLSENLSAELILEKVSEYQIFAFYIPNLRLNTSFQSPLRQDSTPSFSVFYADKIGKLLFRDFATKEKGDCFVFVSKLFSLNYYSTLKKIAYDFGISEEGIYVSNRKINVPKNINYRDISKPHIGIKKQDFTPRDLQYWQQYGITKDTLIKYNVFSCAYIFINNSIFKINNSTNPTYAYLELKDNNPSYKIYQPFNKEQRFISNVDLSIWQGWTLLPKTSKILIITKSLKDVMAITEICKIPSVALQAESIDPKEHIIQQLKNRFEKVFLLYDNDFDKTENWGRQYGSKICETHNLIQIEIPDKYKSKDFSDLVKNHGIRKSKSLILKLITINS